MTQKERMGVVLVVDDEESIRHTLTQILEDEGYEVHTAESGEEGVDKAVEVQPDTVFLDIWLPGIDGIEALKSLRERGVSGSVVMISGHGSIETAVKATKLGAYDFIEKPLSLDRVLLVAQNSIRNARLERQNRALRVELLREAEYTGTSPAVERLRSELAAATDGRPVLLYGEKGTGRRLAARWITLHGLRPQGPFLDVQVSALSRERLILQLFGNPGQVDEPGRIAMADEGTLYLENADMLPPGVQASLAAGAREGVFPVPGGRGLVRSEPLLVVSLAESPEALLDEQLLSEDFLACFPHQVTIPTLRERKQDLVELTERFVDEICREYARETLTIAPEAFETMVDYDWPGNVRELQRTVERLVLLAPGSTIRRADLPPHLLGAPDDEDKGIEDTLARFERRWLAQNLREVGGDVERAAGRLGLSLEEFKARLARFGLDPGSAGE